MDNLQLIVMLLSLAGICTFARSLGLSGILVGSALCQLLGTIVIWISLRSIFDDVRARILIPHALKFIIATVAILAAAAVAFWIRIPWTADARILATVRLSLACLISVIVAGPALVLIGAFSQTEVKTIGDVVKKTIGVKM